MSTIKLEIKGNFLKITDNINENDRVMIKAITSYDFQKNDTVLILKQEQGTNQVTHKLKVSVLVDGTDTPFASVAALETFLSDNLGFNTGGGNGSGVTISQQEANATLFTPGENVGDLAYAENSFGSKWKTYLNLGTYYPSGLYLWDGLKWVTSRDAIANQFHDLIQIDGTIMSTGLIQFGGISINTDNTKFDLGVVKGYVVDNTTDPNNPTKIYVDVVAQTALTPAFLATNPVTYIGIDNTGALFQKNSVFTPQERRDYLFLGVVVHSNNTNINAINNLPVTSYSPMSQLVDIVESIGIFNGSGNVFSPVGGNLKINKSAGEFVKIGVNYDIDPKKPNSKTLGAISSASFRYRNQNSTESPSDITDIDTDTYDLNGVTTNVPNNRWHVQRVAIFSSNIVRIQRAQAHYGSRNAAIRNIDVDPFVVEPNIAQNGLIRGYIVMQEGMTNLSNATFIEAAKFQNIGVGGAGATAWMPPTLTLGDGFANGTTTSLNAGAGIYVNFAQGADNEYVFNVALPKNGIEYDGSEINVSLSWMKFGVGVGTVNWEIDYTFVNLGEDAYSVLDGTLVESVDVTLLTNQTLTSTTFLPISGDAGAKILQVTLRRNSTGAQSDTYTGEAELYGFNLEV